MSWLDPYSARSCPVKIFNAFDPTQPEKPPVTFGDLETASQEFRDTIFMRLAKIPGAVDLSEEGDVASTAAAVAEGAAIVLRPRLPRDSVMLRTGSTDALIRDPDTTKIGYWPLKIKPYRIAEGQIGGSDLLCAPIDHPTDFDLFHNRRYRTYREGALLELAHTWRMLETAGWAAQRPLAAVIGEDPSLTEQLVVWVDLSRRFLRAFSRTHGYRHRSPLNRYDHEYRFRLHVLHSAQARTGVDDPAPVVRPIRIKECEFCQWWESCRKRMDDDDLSLKLTKTPFDVRELEALSRLGVHTITELADADIEQLLPDFLELTKHRDRSELRLRQAQHRANMISRGVVLERTSTEPIGVPRSLVEIDFDIETSVEGRVYLWGCLVSGLDDAPRYVSFARFARLTNAEEEELAVEFASWLLAFLAQHPAALIYHYSDYETVHLRRLADRANHPVLHRVVEVIEDRFVDLYRYVRANFIGVEGLGLKVVATRGANFAWRDDDPGGLQSQAWFADSIDLPSERQRAAARLRVLEYNEDDVRATLEVRSWLTDLDGGLGPAGT